MWAIGNPDNVSIRDVFVFQDVLENGDQLYFARYDVEYGSDPDEDAEDTWQMALYDTDGTTLIATRPLNYYQHNIISIYLDTGEAITWGLAYRVRVMGMPSVFDNLVESTNMRTRTLSEGDYKDGDDLGGIMVTQVGILEDDWATTLLTSDNKLNSTGAITFNDAIPNLSSMAPDIFETTIVWPEVDYTPWQRPYEETLESHGGSRLRGAVQDIGNLLGVSEAWAGGWILSMAFLVFAGAIYAGTRNPALAMIGGFPVVAGGMWLGVGGAALLTAVLLIVFIFAVIFAVYFILGRFA